MNRTGLIILILGLGLLLAIVRPLHRGPAPVSHPRQPSPQVVEPPRSGFNRSVPHLDYTRHAQCRMDCRHITPEEVQDILQYGEINYRKTELDGKPCPAYALEGYTQQEHQHLRIVFAQCDNDTKVVTCIDLDHDFECHCPGDEHKHDN
ncbi:MAG TPA: DUF4258 domain-containing protein [Chitinophagaceae bacterium]|jgi:hypothetical protein